MADYHEIAEMPEEASFEQVGDERVRKGRQEGGRGRRERKNGEAWEEGGRE